MPPSHPSSRPPSPKPHKKQRIQVSPSSSAHEDSSESPSPHMSSSGLWENGAYKTSSSAKYIIVSHTEHSASTPESQKDSTEISGKDVFPTEAPISVIQKSVVAPQSANTHPAKSTIAAESPISANSSSMHISMNPASSNLNSKHLDSQVSAKVSSSHHAESTISISKALAPHTISPSKRTISQATEELSPNHGKERYYSVRIPPPILSFGLWHKNQGTYEQTEATADSAHQTGLKPTLHAVLIVVESGDRG
jgi:hypothetical protein